MKLLKEGRFRFLTISVLENGGVFDESHISISCCQTPENNTFGLTKITQIHRSDVINGACCKRLQKCFQVFKRTVGILLGGRDCDLLTTWRLRRIHRICLFPSHTYSVLHCLPHTDHTGSREIRAGWILAHSSVRRMLPQLSIVGKSELKRFKDRLFLQPSSFTAGSSNTAASYRPWVIWHCWGAIRPLSISAATGTFHPAVRPYPVWHDLRPRRSSRFLISWFIFFTTAIA